MNPMLRIQLHRWGRFTHEGKGFTYAFCCWSLTSQLPEAGHWHAGGQPETYGRPMDDDHDHWLRLEAEAWARDHHPDPEAGKPHGLVHTGGIVHPHPHLKHIKLGGTLSWENEPHPVVQERLDWLHSLDFEGLVHHLCGPNPFKGVLAGAR